MAVNTKLLQQQYDELLADNARMKFRITELEAQLKEVSILYEETHQDACFYKSCALSGEIPKEGSQPSSQPRMEDDHE